jgi:parallel beta-helix repeat protein
MHGGWAIFTIVSRPAILGLASALALATSAGAADSWVATTGDDANPGTQAQPWATLQRAVDSIAPGDRILVQAGSYAGCRIESSGLPGQPKTLMAEPGDAVLVDRAGSRNRHQSHVEVERFGAVLADWEIEGLEVAGAARYGIDVRLADRVTVRGCHVHGSAVTGIFTAHCDDPVIEDNDSHDNGEHGIYHSNSGDRPVIRGNRLHGNASAGLHMNADLSQQTRPGDGIIAGALVERNVIWENGRLGGAAINCDGVTDSVIRNNLVFENHASGVTLFVADGAVGSSRNLVCGNTFVMAADARWVVNVSSYNPAVPFPRDNTIVDNILFTPRLARGSISIYGVAEVPLVSDHNVVVDRFSADDEGTIISLAQWQSLGHDVNSLVLTPAELFVDPAGGDYRLLPGSPAVDAGLDIAALFDDLDGNARPSGASTDIGCHERLSSDPVAGAVTRLLFADADTLTWGLASDATGHDVLRGVISRLRRNLGVGDATCLADDLPSATVDDPTPPPSADGFYYVVRGDGPGVAPGTYDSIAAEGRDAEVGTAGGSDCPR